MACSPVAPDDDDSAGDDDDATGDDDDDSAVGDDDDDSAAQIFFNGRRCVSLLSATVTTIWMMTTMASLIVADLDCADAPDCVGLLMSQAQCPVCDGLVAPDDVKPWEIGELVDCPECGAMLR